MRFSSRMEIGGITWRHTKLRGEKSVGSAIETERGGSNGRDTDSDRDRDRAQE